MKQAPVKGGGSDADVKGKEWPKDGNGKFMMSKYATSKSQHDVEQARRGANVRFR